MLDCYKKGLSAGIVAAMMVFAIVGAISLSLFMSDTLRIEEEFEHGRIKETKLEFDHSKMLLEDAARFSLDWVLYELGRNKTIWAAVAPRREHEVEDVRDSLNNAFNYYAGMLEYASVNFNDYGYYSDVEAEGEILDTEDDMITSDTVTAANFTTRLHHTLDRPEIDMFDEFTTGHTTDIPYFGTFEASKRITREIQRGIGDFSGDTIIDEIGDELSVVSPTTNAIFQTDDGNPATINCELPAVCLETDTCIYEGWGALFLMWLCKRNYVNRIEGWLEDAQESVEDAMPEELEDKIENIELDVVDLGHITVPSSCKTSPCVRLLPPGGGLESYMEAQLYAFWFTVEIEIETNVMVLTDDGYKPFKYQRRYREFPYITYHMADIADDIPNIADML